jgi:hypothetical protein
MSSHAKRRAAPLQMSMHAQRPLNAMPFPCHAMRAVPSCRPLHHLLRPMLNRVRPHKDLQLQPSSYRFVSNEMLKMLARCVSLCHINACLRAGLFHNGRFVAAVGEAVRLGLLKLHLLLLRDGLLRDDFCEALEARCLEPWESC